MNERKVWIARDESGDIFVHLTNPVWIPESNNNGFFDSDLYGWKLDHDSHIDVAKGDKKLVTLKYSIED